MFFFLAFSINENVVEVHNTKNVRLFYQDFVDVVLKHGWCIDQSKRHYLVLEVAIIGLESRFLFIAFFNLHLKVDIS